MVPNVEKRAVGTATVVGAHAARPKPLAATQANVCPRSSVPPLYPRAQPKPLTLAGPLPP